MTAPLVRAADDAGIRTLTLDRGDGHNAIGPDLLAELADALRAAQADDGVRVLVLTGAGAMFSAGGDVRALLVGFATRDEAAEKAALERALETVDLLRTFPRPTIAALNGGAAGGGLALALACDLRIAAEGARLAYAYGRIGLAGDLGVNWLLARIVGPARARAVAFAPYVVAADALRMDLIDECVAPDMVLAQAMRRATFLAQMPPAAIQGIKRNLDMAADTDFATAAAFELDSFQTLRGSTGHRDALAKLVG